MAESERLQIEVRELYALLQRAHTEDPHAPLTSTQRLAMIEIADHGPLRLHELAARLNTTPPTASRAVDALVAAGFVRRVVDERDRRAVQIAVTPRGRAHVDERRARVAEVLSPALRRLPKDDARRLVELLAELNAELRDVVTQRAA